jgi:gliding motility-associated-like protein
MRFTLFLLFFFLFYSSFAQLQSPCDVGKDKYICSDNVILETKSQLPGKWRFSGPSSGVFDNATNPKVTISSISLPIVKVYWVNNDQSCADTIEIVQPAIGTTSLLKNGVVVNGNEIKLCYGDDWKANTSVSKGKSYVAYVLYKSTPPVSPNVYADLEVFKGPVILANNDINNGQLKLNYPNSSNEYWFLPILYNEIGIQGPIIDPTCQISGVPFKITYLDKISISKKEDCMLGQSLLDITGGTSNFDVLDYSPASLSIDSSLISQGKINLSSILVKENYSINVKDDNGCLASFSTKFSPCPACKTDVIYQKTYCIYDSFPSPVLKEGAGIGILELVPANETNLVFDSLTGKIDIQSSKPGNYVIRNKASLSCANQNYTDFNIEILDSVPLPSGNSIDTICISNPKVGDIKDISAQLITWYNKDGDKLDPAIDPVIHGATYYCTQTIKGCESEKKSVKIFAPTISSPLGDTVQFLCNTQSNILFNVLLPNGPTINWYNSMNKKLNDNDLVSPGTYYATQYLGCESKAKLKVNLVTKNINIPYQIPDSLFFCPDQNPLVKNITTSFKNSFIYDLPNSISYLNNDVKLEQGLYYIDYKDSVTKCIANRKKIWVNLPVFDLDIKITEPYCGYQNGEVEIKSLSNQFVYSINNISSTHKFSGLHSGEYILKVKDNSNSKCFLDTNIIVSCKSSDLQEVLSPNFDGKNDFLIFGLSDSYPESKLLVYNRWGNLVYESEIPYTDNWKGLDNVGNPLLSSTYYYVLEKNRSQILKTGFIELIK